MPSTSAPERHRKLDEQSLGQDAEYRSSDRTRHHDHDLAGFMINANITFGFWTSHAVRAARIRSCARLRGIVDSSFALGQILKAAARGPANDGDRSR
jgi:hypothetical protein